MGHPLFRASEVLDMAMQVERSGVAFYEICIQAALGPHTAQVFEYLLAQEHRHLETFTRMKEGLDDYRLPEAYPGELERYLESFIKDQALFKPELASQQAREIDDPFQAVDWAMGFEKNSILFYTSIKQVVRSSERQIVDRVIAEEHSHIRRLLALQQKLKSEQETK